MKSIRCSNHKLGNYEINETPLCYFDDKRYLQDWWNKQLCLWSLQHITEFIEIIIRFSQF